jgi:KRAB domain-containing zinc finger protein
LNDFRGIHEFNRPIGCSFCFKRFNAALEMKRHLKKAHEIADPNLLFYYCAHCQFSSNHKLQLETHIKTHFGIDTKTFGCPICGKGVSDRCNLLKHLFRMHKIVTQNTFFCDKCEFQSLVKPKLELHMKRVHLKTVGDFFCGLCDTVCKTSHEKSLHHYAHSDIVELCNQDQQMLKCTICPNQFQFEDELLQHVGEHESETGNRTTACILCAKVLKGFNQIVEHTKAQHVQKFTHRCIVCNRNYFYSMKFLIHVKNHKEKKNLDHLCTECGAAYTCVADLNKHVRIEHKKVYKCPYCVDVVYKSIPAFRQHVDGHTNNRRFKCPICPKTFSVRNKFNSHYAFHLNDKVRVFELATPLPPKDVLCEQPLIIMPIFPQMNQCPTCGKGFESAYGLKMHMQRHDGTLKKPHSCG